MQYNFICQNAVVANQVHASSHSWWVNEYVVFQFRWSNKKDSDYQQNVNRAASCAIWLT